MPKKVGLPESVKFRHDDHLVDEISIRTRTEIIRKIPIEKIIPNELQPRKDMGHLDELAQSIKEKGILAPILVRPKNGKFEIIAGERRYRAALKCALREIPCIEYTIADNEALEISLIENIQRKELNLFEQAYSLKSLVEIYGYTHQEISEKIGKSRVTVTELIRLTDIPPEISSRCLHLQINSKTFLSQLLQLSSINDMNKLLDEYEKEPFSREKIKDQRRQQDRAELPVKEKQKNSFKFNFITEDKAIKINFNIKADKIEKEKIIETLEKLINDIKEDKIPDLNI